MQVGPGERRQHDQRPAGEDQPEGQQARAAGGEVGADGARRAIVSLSYCLVWSAAAGARPPL